MNITYDNGLLTFPDGSTMPAPRAIKAKAMDIESEGPRTLTVNGRTFGRTPLEGVYPADREKAERDQKLAAEENDRVEFYVSIDLPEPEATAVLFLDESFIVLYAGGQRFHEQFLEDE